MSSSNPLPFLTWYVPSFEPFRSFPLEKMHAGHGEEPAVNQTHHYLQHIPNDHAVFLRGYTSHRIAITPYVAVVKFGIEKKHCIVERDNYRRQFEDSQVYRWQTEKSWTSVQPTMLVFREDFVEGWGVWIAKRDELYGMEEDTVSDLACCIKAYTTKSWGTYVKVNVLCYYRRADTLIKYAHYD